ncbi:MAG: YihA family ribosome biogenesis GTP-binding protein [Candidatus Krumholzibacteria bacterium]|nr:YihA family ribosome biogenesis GTP-binding protein [Candidatus Krumholzibacteria bacterium]
MKIKSLSLAATELSLARFPNTPMREVAIAGRSNVGKSSLLNTLLSRKNIARVSRAPGKTRTVNFFLINDRFHLVDLPGYGYAKVSKTMRAEWNGIIRKYLAERENLSGVIQLIDSRHPPTRDDLEMIQNLVDGERKFLIVFTKVDKISGNEKAKMLKEFRSYFDGFSMGRYRGGQDQEEFEIPMVLSSAKTGLGRDDIWRWIASRL